MIESEIRDVYVCLCCEIRVCIYGDDDYGKLFFNVLEKLEEKRVLILFCDADFFYRVFVRISATPPL